MTEEIKDILVGKSVEEQVEFYKNLYDEVIVFEDYYNKMFPDWDGVFNTKCRLHDEQEGQSFAYERSMNMWSCFGACHKSGRTVYFHYLYRRKTDPNISLIQCLREIHNMMTRNPVSKEGHFVESYQTLPRPELLKASDFFSEGKSLAITDGKTVQEVSDEFQSAPLNSPTENSLSLQTALIFTTETDTSKTYQDTERISNK